MNADKNTNTTEQADLLRRVFVPIEKRTVTGIWTFQTTDKQRYYRNPETGVIRSAVGKMNGKQAKKARARAQRMKCQKSKTI